MKIDDFLSSMDPRFYHACQLRDLNLYVSLGYIASRREMFDLGDTERYTPFKSDGFDRENGYDRSTFGNLTDNGNGYKNGKWIPNIYGPISLEFSLEAFRKSGASEIRIRKRGVYTSDRAGAHPIESVRALRELFGSNHGFGAGEFELVDGKLYLRDLCRVVVVPVRINGRCLIDEVRSALSVIATCDIVEREGAQYATTDFQEFYEWASWAHAHKGDATSLPQRLQEWFSKLNGDMIQKCKNLQRFATYLEHGTTSLLHSRAGGLTAFEIDLEDFESSDDFYDLSDVAELSNEEYRELASLITRIDSQYALTVSSVERYNRNLDANVGRNDLEENRHLAAADYEKLSQIFSEANDWIGSLRKRIESDIDEISHLTDESHDWDIVSELQAFKDLVEDLPTLPFADFSGPVEIAEVNMSALRDLLQASGSIAP